MAHSLSNNIFAQNKEVSHVPFCKLLLVLVISVTCQATIACTHLRPPTTTPMGVLHSRPQIRNLNQNLQLQLNITISNKNR